MSTPILIIGESGSGKSRSIANLPPEETLIVNVIGKDLPFKGWRSKYKPIAGKTGNIFTTDDYAKISKLFTYVEKERPEIKTLIVDDFQYLMTNEFMSQIPNKVTGNAVFEKYNNLAYNAWKLIFDSRMYREDLTIIFLAHSDTDESGKTRCKTMGKMLNDKVAIEGMFTIVLNTAVDNGQYFFETQTNGFNTTKSPDGMFPSLRIPNDLNLVVQSIHKYNTEE